MTTYVETVVNDLIDQFIDKGKCDFMWEFSVPLPCTVIADQLGVPREKIWQLKDWSDAMLAPGGGFADDGEALGFAPAFVGVELDDCGSLFDPVGLLLADNRHCLGFHFSERG